VQPAARIRSNAELTIVCSDISQDRCDSVSGQLSAVECCGRQSAQRLRKKFGAKGTRFPKRPISQLLGKQRSARNRCGAAAAQKTRLHNALAIDTHRKLQDVAANRIAHFDFGIRAGKIARVARMLKMVENGVTKHQQEYSNARFYFFAGRYFLSMAATTT